MNRVPDSMRQTANWCLWKAEERNGTTAKVPYDPNYDGHVSIYDGHASSTDPHTWSTYEKARKRYADNTNFYNGLGFQLSGSGLIFIDLDHCIEGGTPSRMAKDFLNVLDGGYCEVSQSGAGLHFFVRGEIPHFHTVADREVTYKGTEHNAIELYNEKRFCACTFHTIRSEEPLPVSNALIRLLQDCGIDFEKEHRERQRRRQRATRNTSRSNSQVLDVLELIDPIECSYTEWYQIGAALKAEGFSVDNWIDWSAKDPNRFHENECYKKWESFKRESGAMVRAGTIYHVWKKQANMRNRRF